jgi:hypothetical protein
LTNKAGLKIAYCQKKKPLLCYFKLTKFSLMMNEDKYCSQIFFLRVYFKSTKFQGLLDMKWLAKLNKLMGRRMHGELLMKHEMSWSPLTKLVGVLHENDEMKKTTMISFGFWLQILQIISPLNYEGPSSFLVLSLDFFWS